MSAMMARTSATLRTSTVNPALRSAATAQWRGPQWPTYWSAGSFCKARPAQLMQTLFNCSHLYFTLKSKVKICVFFFFPPILKKAQTDQTKSFWIPWNGRWWAGAAEDLRQRTQPSLLPQRQLHAPPSPGDGSGQRGWEGSRVAQGEDRNGEKDLTSSSTFPSEHQLSPRLHGSASLCLLGEERRDRPFTAAPLTEYLAFVNDPV